MFLPPTRTLSAISFSRLPPHFGHGDSAMNEAYHSRDIVEVVSTKRRSINVLTPSM